MIELCGDSSIIQTSMSFSSLINMASDESKARKIEGWSKQPDFIVSIIHQLQSKSVIFIGEVSPPSQKNNIYKNCNRFFEFGYRQRHIYKNNRLSVYWYRD